MNINNLTEGEYEKGFGVSPLRLLNMSYEQKFLLVDEFRSLYKKGIIPKETYDEVFKKYSQLIFKHFPETLQYLEWVESQND